MPNRLVRYVVFRELIDQGTYNDVAEECVEFADYIGRRRLPQVPQKIVNTSTFGISGPPR